MGSIATEQLQWYAMRMRPLPTRRRTFELGADREAYVDGIGRHRVRTIRGTGRRAFLHEHLLERAGFRVFMPVRKEWRRVSPTRPEKELRAYPLLTGWVFVGWPMHENRWFDLDRLGVVAAVCGAGGVPERIPEAQVTGLMRRWGGGRLAPKLQRYMRAGHEFEAGDVVRVDAALMEGLQMTVTSIQGPRTKGLAVLLGRATAVEFDTADLSVVEKKV